jgi:hypothetical protein
MNFFGEEKGTHYRGRILVKFFTHYERDPVTKSIAMEFKFPFNPVPQTPLKTYTLLVKILEGYELPNRDSVGKETKASLE